MLSKTKYIPISVNFHYTRVCNFKCGFCFHTQKTDYHLPIEDAINGLKMLKESGTKKINIAGGEPFSYPNYLGELVKQCKENIKIEKISIVTNGSLVKKDFFKKYGKYVDVFGVSVDSFDKETNYFSLLFFGAKKRGKRNIHPLQTPPYMEGLNRSSRRSFIKVSSPHQRGGLVFFRLAHCPFSPPYGGAGGGSLLVALTLR